MDKQRTKIMGAVITAAALVALGLVLVNNVGMGDNLVPLERAQAIAKAENTHVSLSDLPDEIHVPAGWKVESDEPVDGPGSEGEEEDEALFVPAETDDEDIDSPLDVQQDETGEKYVADELGEDVVVSSDGLTEDGVAADGKYCYRNLKKCGVKRQCGRRCKKLCKPAVRTACRYKKWCKCYCKFKGNYKLVRKCKYYKKKYCKKIKYVKCYRRCYKFCKNVKKCFCCRRKQIAKQCRRRCRRIAYKHKCGGCRCYRVACYKACRFYCKKYY